MPLDLLVRNGTIIDGTGMPAYRADLGIQKDRIVAIGRLRERAHRELDAEGHVVTPGFVDGHTHMDAQLFWDPLGTCSCWHGITTAVMGNCGFTLAPARKNERQLVIRNLERAEDISGAAIAAGVNWTWSTFAEYLDAVNAAPKGINYAANIGHSALRTWAMGERAFDGPATERDLEVMEAELRAALKAGAVGLTTSRNSAHETSDNRPVASRFAAWSEVCRLVGVMGEMGAGVFELAGEDAISSPDEAVLAEYLGRLRDLAVETRVPFTFGVLGNRLKPTFDLMESTTKAGGRMFGMSHSRGVAVLLSFLTRLPFDVLPEWKELRKKPLSEQRQALQDPATRRRLIHEAHHGEYGRAIGAEARKPDFSAIRIFNKPLPPHPIVADVAAQQGKDPVELMIDLALERDFDQFFVQPLTSPEDDVVLAAMRHPRVAMTFSDSGAHVSQILDASIQTHLLAYWVRERQAFTLEEAVRMITLSPAQGWGFSDRGQIREGMIADLNVFDPAKVGPDMPVVVTDLPGGSKRLTQTAHGFLATIVAGEITLDRGNPTGRLPGRLLRNVPRYNGGE
jgi:N-acyl-D-aspartate/D-glutamate deacylase